MKSCESTEMYLETIFVLAKEGRQIRAIDIANALEYSKPSVSIAMKKMKDCGLIKVDEDGFITFTREGCDIAERMYARHTWISEWLMGLGVSRDTALEDACRIEHVISEETFQAIKRLL